MPQTPKKKDTKTTIDSKQPQVKVEERIALPRSAQAEIGVAGEQQLTTFYNEELRVDDLKLADYRRMKNNDGQIQMLLNAIQNTILSVGFRVEEDQVYLESQGDEPEDSEEKKFIENNLFAPEWKGGLDRNHNFTVTLRRLLRAIEDGFMVFELIYRVDPDGFVRLVKMAPRVGRNDYELRLVHDGSGNFKGFHQRIYTVKDNEYREIDVQVTNDSEIAKTVLAVWGREYGSLYGRSILKAPWYHYNSLHKVLYAVHVAIELGAVKFRHLKKLKRVESEADKLLFDALRKAGIESVIQYNGEDHEIIFDTVTDAQTLGIGKDIINYHTTQISKSLLMQFMDLGINSETGARALSNDQMRFFKDSLNIIAQEVIETPLNQVIADLIRMNFNSGIYPTLKINPISDEHAATLFEAFQNLVKSGDVVDTVKGEIQEVASEKLGLEIDGETIMAEMAQLKKDKAEQAQMQQDFKAKALDQKTVQKKQELVELEDMVQRDLYPDERKVKLAEIAIRMDSAKAEAETILMQKLDKQKEKIINSYLFAMRKGRKSIKSTQIELQDNADLYSQALLAVAYGVLEFGKITAANELQVTVPTTNVSDRQIIEDEVDNIIYKQTSDLQFRLRQVANRALQQNIPENETRLLLQQEFNDLFASALELTLVTVIATSINLGRQITFNKHQDMIFAYRYTAVLDDRTTDYCRALDGTVVQWSDVNFSLLTPPKHFRCRSIWTPITNTEAEEYGIEVTGKPADVPVYSGLYTNKYKI